MFPPQRNPYEQYLDIPTQRMRTNFSDFQLSPQITGPGELSGVNMGDYGGPPLPPQNFGAKFGQEGPEPPPPMPPPQMSPSGPPPVSSNPLMDPRIPMPSLPGNTGLPSTERTPFDVEAEMAKYQPEHTASDKFNQLISQYPGREKPGLLQTIAASLAALGPGGQQAGQQVMHGDYQDKLADWKNQTATAQQAANLERYQNVNERTMRYQTVTAQLRESADRARAENNERKAQIAEERLKVYDYKSKHTNWQLHKEPGGNVWGRNPDTGRWEDTGMSSGTLTKMDEINLGIEGRKEVAQVQHQGRMEEIGQRDTNLTKQKGIPQKREFSPYGRSAGTSGESGYMKPSQQIAMERANADRLKNTNPELGKWVHWDGRNLVVDPPDSDETPDSERSFWQGARTGPTKKEYEQISSAIYGPMRGDVAADRNRASFAPKDPEAAKHDAKLGPNSPFHYIKNPNYRGKPGEEYWIPERK